LNRPLPRARQNHSVPQLSLRTAPPGRRVATKETVSRWTQR
jgi:hypothetical protein